MKKYDKVKYSKKARKKQIKELARQNGQIVCSPKAQKSMPDPLMEYVDSIVMNLTPEEQKIARRFLRENKYRTLDPSFTPDSYTSERRTVELSGPYAGNAYRVLEALDKRLDDIDEEARIEQEKYDAWHERIGKWGSRTIEMPSYDAVDEMINKTPSERGITTYFSGDKYCNHQVSVFVNDDGLVESVTTSYVD